MLKKLFFETKMTWKRVILFALAAAVVTAAVLILPFTANSSIANLGVTFEAWVLFALIIIMNCEKPLEAGLKTFVFFLISQPLIYLLQVPFYFDGWNIFRYYPYWFVLTLLCFPGGMIAWYVKKNSVLSALILSVATGLLAYIGVYFLADCLRAFPKNLLSILFILALIVVLISTLLHTRRLRLITAAITLAVALVAAVPTLGALSFETETAEYALDDEHRWYVSYAQNPIGGCEVDPADEYTVHITAEQYGTSEVTFCNEDGETLTLTIRRSRGDGLTVTPKE